MKTLLKKDKKKIKSLDLLLLLIPAAIYLIIFHYIPMFGIQIAFKDFSYVKGIWGSEWIGFEHFERFFSSYYFGEIMTNTILLSVYSLLFGFPIPIILSVLLNHLKSRKFKRVFQTISYAPNFISLVIIVGMLVLFLNPRTGLVNVILSSLGFDAVNFLENPNYFRSIYVASGIWQGTGFAMIVYIAALSAIDPTLYEAADMDGATKLQKIIHIDLPSIAPTVTILFILSIGGLMNVGFEKAFLLQNVLNTSVSEIIPTYVYKMGLIRGDSSFATAIGLFNTVINVVLLFIANKLAKMASGSSLW